jgi:hypothetical protein
MFLYTSNFQYYHSSAFFRDGVAEIKSPTDSHRFIGGGLCESECFLFFSQVVLIAIQGTVVLAWAPLRKPKCFTFYSEVNSSSLHTNSDHLSLYQEWAQSVWCKLWSRLDWFREPQSIPRSMKVASNLYILTLKSLMHDLDHFKEPQAISGNTREGQGVWK